MTESFTSNEPEPWRQRVFTYRFLPLILILSLTLNLWGNRWGAPNLWHPDEVIARAISMVSQRTLNPHHFVYGGLHYYILALGAILPVIVYAKFFDHEPREPETEARRLWEVRQKARIISLGRAISALMSTLVVCFTFVIGGVLFDRRAGYLAALLLTVSMHFVAIAHYATVDAPANFWYWLSCLFALLVWKRGGRRWYILAAVSAGLAIGTKIDRLFILFPLLVSHLMRRKGWRFGTLLSTLALLSLVFVLTNPTLIVAPFEFLDGFTRDFFFNFLRGTPGHTSYRWIVKQMNAGLGWPLCTAALAGLAYELYDLTRQRNPMRIVWVLATFVPYYVFYGSKLMMIWYIPFFFPPLMILVAHVCVDLVSGLQGRYRLATASIIAAIVLYSLLYSVALVLQFSNDSRYQAHEWIEQHVPARATVQIFRRPMGPEVSQEKYQIIDALQDKEAKDSMLQTRERLDRHRIYVQIRQVILELEGWAGRRFGLTVRERPYMAYFDRSAASYEDPLHDPPGFLAVLTHQPDYVVLVGEGDQKTLSGLRSPHSEYTLAAHLRFVNSFGIRPFFPFLNPPVYIFQREVH